MIARRALLPDCSVITGNARKEEDMDRGWGTRPILAAFMPVRTIQKKWAPRAVLFPWEIGGYMALAVLIAVMADGLDWALDIGVAVLAGAAAACIVQLALSWNLSMANSAGQRSGRKS